MPKQIPEFQTEDEEREFWRLHDSADYLDWDQAENIEIRKPYRLARIESARDHRYTVKLPDGVESLAAQLSGPLTSLEVLPKPGQLAAVELSYEPAEIVHVYEGVDPVGLTEAERAALESESFPGILRRHTPPEPPSEPDPNSPYMSWTGLAAEIWDASGGDDPQGDHDYLRRVVERNGGPALDVGCGTGRLLLRFLAAGLDVEGVDSSADMLALCRRKAEAAGLNPILYQQSMHALDLPRRYRTIFIACGTFCLLVNREDARQALERMHAHLEPGGELVFNLFWEIGAGGWFWNEPDGKWHTMFHHALPNGDLVFQYMWTDQVDRVEQLFTGRRRYRLVREGRVLREEVFPSNERVYGKNEVRLMLERSGFRDVRIYGDWTEEPFSEGHSAMVIHARK